MHRTRRALVLSTAVAGALLVLTPPVHASPDAGSCRSPNLLSDAVFPNGTDIKPRHLGHGVSFVGRVCENGRWREYW